MINPTTSASTRLTEQLRELEGDVAELENRWMEISEILE